MSHKKDARLKWVNTEFIQASLGIGKFQRPVRPFLKATNLRTLSSCYEILKFKGFGTTCTSLDALNFPTIFPNTF